MSAFFDHISRFRRFYAAGLVGVLMLCMLGRGIGAMATEKDPSQNVYQNYSEEKENSELNDLISSYYKAYAGNDTEGLKAAARPFSDSELSYIAMMSEYVDSYTIEKIYSKNGLTDGSYLVSVYVDMKFSGIDTAAPGLDFFYVETDPDTGKLFINNLYSTYNLNNNENAVDSQVATMIAEFEQQEDVQALQADVQKEYNAATIEDGKLKTFIETTLQEKITEWAKNYQQSLKDAEAAAAQAAADQKAAEEKAAADAAAAEQAAAAAQAAAAQQAELNANGYDVITAERVNMRQSADQNSQSLGMVENSTVVKKFGDEGDWSIIEYNGMRGYIKTAYLWAIQANTARDVTLTTSVNIRQYMSENSTKLVLAQSGTTLHINFDSTSGWSQIAVDGTTVGYARTEYLH